jgi:hypothetical protein
VPDHPTRSVAPYFDTGAVVCEVYEGEVGAAAAAGPLATAELPEPDPKDHCGFLTTPAATVELKGLSPGTHLHLRSRCVARLPDAADHESPAALPAASEGAQRWRWELPWSDGTGVATMRGPRRASSQHPPKVLQVRSTSVTLRVWNPGVVLVVVA